MTLDEAIKHCYEVAEHCENTSCALDHTQLAKWLKELREFKKPIDEDELVDMAHGSAIIGNTMTADQEYWYRFGFEEGYRKALKQQR